MAEEITEFIELRISDLDKILQGYKKGLISAANAGDIESVNRNAEFVRCAIAKQDVYNALLFGLSSGYITGVNGIQAEGVSVDNGFFCIALDSF